MNSIENAQYLIKIGDGATVLCPRHAEALAAAHAAAGQELDVYEIDPEEEPISCHACHLVAVKDSPDMIQ